MNGQAFKLYAQPSIFEGVARIMDIFGDLNQYNYSDNISEADYRAIFSDWEIVGKDILNAIEEFEEKHKKGLHD